MGKTIKIPAGTGEIDCYLATPCTPGGAPAIILLHEIFGVNFHIRRVADLFADVGFLVVAPNMYWRTDAGFEQAYDEKSIGIALLQHQRLQRWTEDLYQKLPTKDDLGGDADSMMDIQVLSKFIGSMPECSGKVAAVGYCLGGRLAVLAAAEGLVDAAVGYYATYLDLLDDAASKINCPVLLHQPQLDRWISPDAIERIERSFVKNPHVRMHIYPEAEHGFDSDQKRALHNRWASQLSNIRTVRFLDKVIGPLPSI